MSEIKDDDVQEVVEVGAEPTAALEFRDGVLHQRFLVHRSDGSSTPEWRQVPATETPKE